jgi:alkanesulfonate monooxygenase SsuD/methylene tetrahydromethanopterin reductase-like flavin-dependent oxidoreductase (luciferase family)
VLGPRQRVERYVEFVEVVDTLLRQPFTTYRSSRYVIDEAPMLPGCVQQPRLPLALAAGGPRTLAVAARFGDAWITYGDTTTETRPAAATQAKVREQSQRLAEACGAIGRDPAELDRIYLIGNTEERPLASLDAFEDFARRYRDLGFTDLVFHHPRPGDPVWSEPETIVEEIATELLPGLR